MSTLGAITTVLCMATLAVTSAPAMRMSFEELGVPVREASVLSWCIGPDAAGKMNTVYLSHNQQGATLFLVALNVETGEAKQYPAPVDETGAWACCRGADGRIYLGTYYTGRVLRFDPKTEEFVDLGRASSTETYLYKFSPTSDGKIYAGSYGHAKLIEIDTATGKLSDLGRMCETEMYTRATWYGEKDRTVYCVVQTVDPHIAAYVRDTGEKKRVRFPGWEGEGFPWPYEAEDGYVYAGGPGKLWRLVKGEAQRLDTEQAPPKRVDKLWDGRVVTGVRAGCVTLALPGTEYTWDIKYTYDCVGSQLFVVREGPGGRIYGSSVMPLRVFEYDPATGKLVNLGQGVNATGEVYSFARLDGKLYIAAYPGAALSVYDPSKPYNFGADPQVNNPVDLGRLGEEQNRPTSMEVGFDGNIWIASRPAYGTWGGALSRLQPDTFKKTIWRNIVPDQSVVSLAMDPAQGLVWAATDIRGGGGTTPKAKEAVLFAFDVNREEKVFECVPVPGVTCIAALQMGSDGLLYGSAGSIVFIFDPRARKLVRTVEVPGAVHMEALQVGDDGWLYGMGGDSFFRISPTDHHVEILGSYPGATCGFALVGRDIYFGAGVKLCVGHLENE